MTSGIFTVPNPINEPVRAYLPGSAERASLEARYDQMIGEGNADGNAVVQAAIDALVAQTRTIEKVVTALDVRIDVEGSDSLDNPSAVNQ